MTSAPAFAFTCTKCGHCCQHGGPALSIVEVFKYQDVFISGLTWAASSIPHTSVVPFNGEFVDAPTLRDHVARYFPASFSNRGDTIYSYIYPIVTGYSVKSPCSALAVDGTCGLHDDKPAMCRSVPFDPALPESLQGVVLRRFRHDCMTTTDALDTANIIFRDGRIVDPSAKHDYDNRLTAMKKDSATLGLLAQLLHSNASLVPTMDAFMGTVKRGGWIETSMLSLLIVLVQQQQISPGDAKRYVCVQMELINIAIKAALQRHNPDERGRTAIMRNYLVDYRPTLAESFRWPMESTA